MSKQNGAFNKNQQTEQRDPVAEAHKAHLAGESQSSDAGKTDTSVGGDNSSGENLETVVVTVHIADKDASASADASKAAESTGATTAQPGTEGEQTPINAIGKAMDSIIQTPVPEESKEPVYVAPIVADTTKVVEAKELVTSTITATPRDSLKNTVIRPSGAAARVASPVAKDQKPAHVTSNDFSTIIASEKMSGTADAQALIHFLEQYVSTMAPRKAISIADILRMQGGLHDKLRHIIEKAPSREFKRLWNICISFVREYKDGAFNPVYYGRGAKDWKRDPSQFTTLTNLINLLQASATSIDTVTQQVSIESVVKTGFSEDGRGRMINFYMK